MTREEAILLSAYTGFLLVQDFSDVHKFCEDTLGRPIWTHEFADEDVQKEIQDKLRPQIMKLIYSTNALRPVSREQAEKVFPGCRSCKSYRSCVFSIHAIKDMPCKKCDPNAEGVLTEYKPSKFCPVCGKPLTDEAVEMVMKRLEALHGET